jgi:hypothetical protein
MEMRERVLKAVESLNYRVTVGDVSAQSGLQLAVVQQELNSLAAAAEGSLQVSSTGEIVYAFDRDTKGILERKDRNAQLKALLKKIGETLFYLVRISFGILLVLSLLIIVVAIFLLMTANSRDDNNGRSSSRDGGGFFPGFFFSDLQYLFWPDPYSNRSQRRGRDKDELGFLESIFSFLFGDGDPNRNLDEQRWQAIGNVIRANQGVVIAEQLAPYFDNARVDSEDFLLPALVKFDGQPEVSEAGEIIYRFPQLQTQAQERTVSPSKTSEFLQEKLWKFSKASGGQLTIAGGLGTLNFLGAWYLFFALSDARIPSDLFWLLPLIGVLVTYGTLFLAIPAVRYFVLRYLNRGIVDRNGYRSAFARQLREANATLKQKLAFARQFATKKVIANDDVIYSSDKSMLEQRDTDLDAQRFKELEDRP